MNDRGLTRRVSAQQSRDGPTALVIGVTSQDGAYLSRLLLGRGYRVVGTARPGSSLWRLVDLGIEKEVEIVPADLGSQAAVSAVVRSTSPTEIYNFAALSSVAESFRDPAAAVESNATAVARLLHAVISSGRPIRLYQASSSEMFGSGDGTPFTEASPFNPQSPYAIAKVCGHQLATTYRELHGVHATCGILFNHESPLRGEAFVTRKITLAMARRSLGDRDVLRLGNLDARRDWGFAGDYVEGMWRMLQRSEPRDYILATGMSHTVREFTTLAARTVGIDLNWVGSGVEERGLDAKTREVVVVTDPALYRPLDLRSVVGDPSRARTELGWKATMSLQELVPMMVEADIARAQQGAVR